MPKVALAEAEGDEAVSEGGCTSDHWPLPEIELINDVGVGGRCSDDGTAAAAAGEPAARGAGGVPYRLARYKASGLLAKSYDAVPIGAGGGAEVVLVLVEVR